MKSGTACGSALLLVLLCSACGSSPTSPTMPGPTPTPPVPATITITGHVSATQTNAPLGGLSVALGTTTTTTDGSGTFSASMLPAANVSLMLTGSGIVPRTIRVAATNTRDVTADAIALGSGFDLNFYRQFIRDGLDTPAANYPLRRWTKQPQILLKTVDEAGTAINGPTLASTEQALRESLPLWTGGQFQAAITRGTDSRAGQSGWLTILWSTERPAGKCGNSGVGQDGGTITLYPYGNCQCGSNVVVMYPRLVKHELGHAMGFFHTDAQSDVMYGGQLTFAPTGVCDAQPSVRERYHAAIAYQRPVGNSDPDQDPLGVVNLAPLRAIQ